MEQKIWTMAELSAGYEAMAEINLTLAEEFFPLEDEAAALCENE